MVRKRSDGKSSEEDTLLALLVVDQLATHCPMQAFGRLAQVVNAEWWPIFAETVGQYPIGAGAAMKVENVFTRSLQTANALNFKRLPGMVSNLDLNLAKRTGTVHTNRVDQIGLTC